MGKVNKDNNTFMYVIGIALMIILKAYMLAGACSVALLIIILKRRENRRNGGKNNK